MRSALRCALAVLVLAQPALPQEKAASGLAATPPMGWNSWNWFAGKVTDKDIRQAADLMVSSGMRDAGYVYVNIDDTWEGQRDAGGVLHTNEKFPDMKALADYVHGKGLKLGIYSSPGPKTCAGYEGSYGHEQQDADMYASWGIDYLKYDLCSFGRTMREAASDDKLKQNEMMRAAYEKMHQAILKTGRPMVYSLVPVRRRRGVAVGAGGGRQSVADDRRHQSDVRPDEPDRARTGGAREVRGTGALERSGHAGGRQRKAHGG